MGIVGLHNTVNERVWPKDGTSTFKVVVEISVTDKTQEVANCFFKISFLFILFIYILSVKKRFTYMYKNVLYNGIRS